MTDLWNYLKTASKPILLYGMGDGADKIISVLNRYGIKISGVFASDGFVRKKIFHGFEVCDYTTAKSRFGDMIVLLCFGTPLGSVIDNIKRIAAEQELYAPDVPVYGNTLFNMEYARENADKLRYIYNLLADEQSKKVFENTTLYKLSGDIRYLFDCESEPREAYEAILKLTDTETYFDLGAYRGDTVAEFLHYTKGYNKIVAVEPDKKTYIKLCTATEGIKNITNINAAVSDKCGKIEFCMNASRGSNAAGGVLIDSISVDSLLNYGAPTFIKMDIEGAELAAVTGATENLIKHKPKLQLATYHRSEDLIVLPLSVLKINPEYKLYMRHFPCLPSWDINYYFI